MRLVCHINMRWGFLLVIAAIFGTARAGSFARSSNADNAIVVDATLTQASDGERMLRREGKRDDGKVPKGKGKMSDRHSVPADATVSTLSHNALEQPSSFMAEAQGGTGETANNNAIGKFRSKKVLHSS